MPAKGKDTDGYKRLSEAIKAGSIGKFYIFHGEERYLLERGLGELRASLCPDGLDGFNYKRYEGKTLSVAELDDAVDTLPAFSERTLIEVHDFDIFKHEQKETLLGIFSDLPEYVCLTFIFDTVAYKPDGRVKVNTEITKKADVLEFVVQDQDKLIDWINRHFANAGKKISTADAEHLAFISGGLMSTLVGEIGKAAAYSDKETVSRADIDAVVTPVLDAVSYQLTDALAQRDHKSALKLLDDLFQMREEPHKLMFSISLRMRQLLTARVCIDSSLGAGVFMETCGIRSDYQARVLMDTARRMSLTECRDAVLHCAQTALDLNSTPEPESRMIELVARLAR